MHFEQISINAFGVFVFFASIGISIAAALLITFWVNCWQASPFWFAIMLTLATFSAKPAYDGLTPRDMEMLYRIFLFASVLICVMSFIRFLTWDPLARERRRQQVRERARAEALRMNG